MKNALKINVNVGADHVVKLPDEVPVGPAEIIVLVNEPAAETLEDFEPIKAAKGVRLSALVIEGRD
jgi:hypothetical protein